MKAHLIGFVVASLLLPLTASAAGNEESAKEADCTDRPKAKRAFDAGHLAYRRGEYEAAILKFQDSYRLCKQPLTLLAIGNAYERLGDLNAALEHLKNYRPNAEPREHEELDNRIAALESRIAEQNEKKEKEEEERRAREEALRKAEADRQQNAEQQPEQEHATGPLTWAGWCTGAVGVAALAGSVVTGAWALSLDRDLADGCLDGICPADRGADVDRLEKLSTATDVLIVLGATMTAGGILMLLLDQRSDSSASVGLSLRPGPGGAWLQGSF